MLRDQAVDNLLEALAKQWQEDAGYCHVVSGYHLTGVFPTAKHGDTSGNVTHWHNITLR